MHPTGSLACESLDVHGFPRLLLILGGPLQHGYAAATAILNLLGDWPRDRLANLYYGGETYGEPDPSLCHINYALKPAQAPEKLPRPIRRTLNPLFLLLGRGDYYGYWTRLAGYRPWLERFDPQVIYAVPTSVLGVSVTLEVADAFDIPFCVHFMDDWMGGEERLIAEHWGRSLHPMQRLMAHRYPHLLSAVMQRAFEIFTICDPMRQVCRERYGRNSSVLANAIDFEHWQPHRTTYTAGVPFRLVYRGGLSEKYQLSAFEDICDVVAELGAAGVPIEMEVATPELFRRGVESRLARHPFVRFVEMRPLEELPRLLAEPDLLLLPVTFNPIHRDRTRYSMPNKIPEYLASGTPVLVYGPLEMASVAYAYEEGWGYVVSQRDKALLKKAILTLMRSGALREQLGRRARQLALQRHDIHQMRGAFWEALCNAAAAT